MKHVVEQDLEVGMSKSVLLLIGLFLIACAREPISIEEDQAGGTLRNLMQYQEDGNYAFDCSVTGFTPTSYSWDFGDGAARVTGHKGVAHTYTESGTYFVTCTASDGASNITTNATVTVSLPEIPREDVEALADSYPSSDANTREFDLGLFDDLDTYESDTLPSTDDFEEYEEYEWDEYEWESEEFDLEETGSNSTDQSTMKIHTNNTNGTADTGYGTVSGTNSTSNTTTANKNSTILINSTISTTQDNMTDDVLDDDGFDLDILEDDDEESDEENGESGTPGGGDTGGDEDAPGMDEEEQEDDDREDREQRDEENEVKVPKKVKRQFLLS